jgi:hypothetical protein
MGLITPSQNVYSKHHDANNKNNYSQLASILMVSINSFNRPDTFQKGELYLFRAHSLYGNQGAPSIVAFSSYTSSPAFVIIQNNTGSKIRCPRDDLFELLDPKMVIRPVRNPTLLERIKSFPGSILRIVYCIL